MAGHLDAHDLQGMPVSRYTALRPMLRERCGLAEGDELIAEVDEFGIHLYSLEQACRRSATLLAPYIDPSRSLSEELLHDRREEACRE
ncbi:MAG: hypothetical protein JO112_18510 [Planctomycetes bacterium]|nr:hypothetical protein [Planctomycetota bacterium]